MQHLDWCKLLSSQDAAALCKSLPYEIMSLRIKCLRFRLPDIVSWKLEVVVDSFELQVRQKAMPTQVRQIMSRFRSCVIKMYGHILTQGLCSGSTACGVQHSRCFEREAKTPISGGHAAVGPQLRLRHRQL